MELFGVDAFSPSQITEKIRTVGVSKAHLPLLAMVMLGIAGGGFISLGAIFYTVVGSDPTIAFGISRLLAGLAFCLGLILVVVAGGELFTGNNLLVMAWADGKITTGDIIKNWVVIYSSNALGAFGMVAIVYFSGHAAMNHGGVAEYYVEIAATKTALSFSEAFFRGVLCNLLVCLAVWLASAGRSVTDKILALIFPVAAFIAAGFEHCIANMFFIPMGILYNTGDALPNWSGLVGNLIPVTLGNIVGGSIMVATFYYIIYVRAMSQEK